MAISHTRGRLPLAGDGEVNWRHVLKRIGVGLLLVVVAVIVIELAVRSAQSLPVLYGADIGPSLPLIVFTLLFTFVLVTFGLSVALLSVFVMLALPLVMRYKARHPKKHADSTEVDEHFHMPEEDPNPEWMTRGPNEA